MTEIMKVGDAIKWQEAELYKGSDSSMNDDKVTLCFFGECGTGKSTDLTQIARIYKIQHKEACQGQIIQFVSGQSIEAVTTKVKVVKIGNMTLIDTPGTNDADKTRTD